MVHGTVKTSEVEKGAIQSQNQGTPTKMYHQDSFQESHMCESGTRGMMALAGVFRTPLCQDITDGLAFPSSSSIFTLLSS